MKKLFKFLFSLVLVLVIIASIGVGVLHFTTPTTFGLADFEVANGMAVSDMGLAETTNLEIAVMAYKLVLAPNADSVVDETSVATEADFAKVKEELTADDVEVNYSDLIDGKINFSEPVKIELSKGEVTALLNMAFNNGAKLNEISTKNLIPQKRFDAVDKNYLNKQTLGTTYENAYLPDVEDLVISRNDVLQVFESFDIYIESITPELVGSRIFFTTVFSISVPSSLIDQLGALPISISEKIYVTCRNEMALGNKELQPLVSAENNFRVNTMSESQSETLVGVLLSNLGVQQADFAKATEDYVVVVGGVISSILNNLGDIDSVTSDGISITTHSK